VESNYYKHLHSEESKGTKEYELHRAMKCLELIAKGRDKIAAIYSEYSDSILPMSTNSILPMSIKWYFKIQDHQRAIWKLEESYNNIIHNLTKF